MKKIINYFHKLFRTNSYIIDKMMNTWEFDYKIDVLNEKSINIQDSKLFWIPYNPIGEKIPKNSNWKDLQLLLQINLEDLIENEKLPKDWFLQVFIHSDYIYWLMDNKYNNLVVRYIKKSNIELHDKKYDYKIFFDEDRKVIWLSDWYKLNIYKDKAYLSINCLELFRVIGINPYEIKFINKIISLKNHEYSWFLYNKNIKNRLFWFPYFIQNEIREDKKYSFQNKYVKVTKHELHKWYRNLITINFNEEIKLEWYWWEDIMLNILIHDDDLKELRFDNLLHELDCT